MAGKLPVSTPGRHGTDPLAAEIWASREVARAIAEQLVTALDRLAAVHAAVAPGSAASVSLNLAQAAVSRATELAGRLAALAEERAEDSSPFGFDVPGKSVPLQILLVDDDELVRTSVAALLLSRRLRVLSAADGRQALDLFLTQADAIDAVVLDMDLPVMNGSTILRELRAIRPDVKVLIASGGSVDPLDPHLDGCNRLAFAHKSLGPHELIAQLERLLGRKL
jgi:CheY-like chemotaxis protein